MAYFLKKINQKGRTYLSIVESFYDPKKKGTSHKSYKACGSVETNIAKGIKDPISHFQKEVNKLNKEKKEESERKISDVAPIVHLGYFPFKSIMEKLNVKKYIDYFQLTNKFEFNLYEVLSLLVYGRVVNPCSKYRTYHDVLPYLNESYDFSYEQSLTGLGFLGDTYEKIVEIFTVQVDKVFKLDTKKTYFDCTNFYFEIDREDDFRRKGPSKENRKDPIIGMGLLLDNNQIPIGMKLFPGNESEKPIMREVIDKLKKQNNIVGRTIHVADKGLNCSKNIAFSKLNKDGYIFSKSVKTLPEKEMVWVLLDQDFIDVKNEKGDVLYRYKSCVDEFPYVVEHEGYKKTINLTEKRILTFNPSLAKKKQCEINKMVDKALALRLSEAKKDAYGESGKYVTFTDENGDKAKVTINQEAIDKDLKLAGYNLLVSSEVKMPDQEIYNTYHSLWKIEETFKIMKSDLDARPAFAQKESTIKGHFLICYIDILLERLLEIKVLENEFCSSEIFDFTKDFNATKNGREYINTAKSSKIIDALAEKFNLPLANYHLKPKQIKEILAYQLHTKFTALSKK